MVLSEKSSLKNGQQRSRGASPNSNGGASPESPVDEEGEKIRVGRDYQAVCPDLVPVPERKDKDLADRALLVWCPSTALTDNQLDEYIHTAKERYGYNSEQALGMLFWHKHDLAKAVDDLGNFTPFPDDWTVEDKVLFEQAFTFHGKTFHRIKQMLPDKSMGSLVKYYYSWKKTRTRTSLMDRQARKIVGTKEEPGSEHGSEQGSNSDSESEEKNQQQKENGDLKDKEGKTYCHNCGIPCTLVQTSNKPLCRTCFDHWRETGNSRPTIGPLLRGRDRHRYKWFQKKARPPRGMHVDHDDLLALATPAGGGSIAAMLDREIASLKRQVQANKQTVSSLKRKATENIDELRPNENNSKIQARWTSEELALAVQGVRKFGKNFKAIAETLGTKSEAHVRQFFTTHRKRYNLDTVLKDFEEDSANNHVAATNENNTENKEEKPVKTEEKMETDFEVISDTAGTK